MFNIRVINQTANLTNSMSIKSTKVSNYFIPFLKRCHCYKIVIPVFDFNPELKTMKNY